MDNNLLMTIGQYSGAIIAIITATTLIIKYVIIKPMAALDETITTKVEKKVDYAFSKLEKIIEERTKPIQPNANGGQSLADIHKRMDRLEATHTEILLILTTPKKRGRPPKTLDN